MQEVHFRIVEKFGVLFVFFLEIVQNALRYLLVECRSQPPPKIAHQLAGVGKQLLKLVENEQKPFLLRILQVDFFEVKPNGVEGWRCELVQKARLIAGFLGEGANHDIEGYFLFPFIPCAKAEGKRQ